MFAKEVLGWPDVVARPFDEQGSDDRFIRVGDAAGSGVAVLEMRPWVGDTWWVVTWVGGVDDVPGLGVAIRGAHVEMHFDRRNSASVMVTIGYGAKRESRRFLPREQIDRDLHFRPATTGYFLIRFLDDTGRAIAAQGAALPAGDFAAG